VTSLLCGVWFRFVIDRRLELYEGAPALAPGDEVPQGASQGPTRDTLVHP